ncbi:Rieske (2Fe-2S) protein [Pararobbsia silviterrae]|nr:Rieske (2Fe-2S) protein [Pararobbsia silviterrae]
MTDLTSHLTYVCDSRDLPSESAKAVVVDARELVAWRDSAGDAHVWDDRCPHQGSDLASGGVEGCVLVCPSHGWRFDINGQFVVPLRVFSESRRPPVFARTYETVEQDGRVFARLTD